MKPIIGSIVLFVLAEGVIRPAIIVEDWGNGKAEAQPGASAVNLRVFTDGANDEPLLPPEEAHGHINRSSALFDQDAAPGTWHWPQVQ